MHDIITTPREGAVEKVAIPRNKMSLKLVFKRIVFGLSLVFTSPLIILTYLDAALFGHKSERIFCSCKELIALVPTIVGEYIRLAYYWAVCQDISPDACFMFGSMIAHRDTIVRAGAVIGTFSIIGFAEIDENVMIAARVSLISGKYQHGRPQERASGGSLIQTYDRIHVGKNTWIGQQAIIMASVGENCTIGAGSVVYREIPPNSTFIGNPARKVSIDSSGKGVGYA